jgi:hypothetical protein
MGTTPQSLSLSYSSPYHCRVFEKVLGKEPFANKMFAGYSLSSVKWPETLGKELAYVR